MGLIGIKTREGMKPYLTAEGAINAFREDYPTGTAESLSVFASAYKHKVLSNSPNFSVKQNGLFRCLLNSQGKEQSFLAGRELVEQQSFKNFSLLASSCSFSSVGSSFHAKVQRDNFFFLLQSRTASSFFFVFLLFNLKLTRGKFSENFLSTSQFLHLGMLLKFFS